MTKTATATDFDADEIVIFDLEYTSWDGAHARNWSLPGEHREIVRIGAVRFSMVGGLMPVDVFDVFVQPLRNPTLSKYFIDLTGISQERVDSDGLLPQAALDAFAAFLGPDTPAFSFGRDGAVIEENERLNGVRFARKSQLFDQKPFLMDALDLPDGIESGKVALALGVVLDGKPHVPVYDCRSQAYGLAVALNRPWLSPMRRVEDLRASALTP